MNQFHLRLNGSPSKVEALVYEALVSKWLAHRTRNLTIAGSRPDSGSIICWVRERYLCQMLSQHDVYSHNQVRDDLLTLP